MKNQQFLSVLTLSLLAIFGLNGCKQEAETEQEHIPYVLTTTVEAGKFLQWSLVGEIQAKTQAVVGFQTAGEVEEKLVFAGDKVEKNQVLLRLNPADLQLKKSALQANIKSLNSQVNLAKSEANRAKELLNRQLISQQDFDRSQNQVTILEQQTISQERELDLINRQLSYTELKSLAPALVQKVLLEKGDITQVGQPAVELIYTDGIDLVVQVPANRVQNLPKQALAKLDGFADLQTAELRELNPKTQGSAKTWQAKYRLNLDFEQINLGATAQLIFNAETDYIKVPIASVFEQGKGAKVWRINEGKLEAVAVEVVHLTKEHALLDTKTQLQAGDKIVKSGVHLLQPDLVVQEREL